MPVFSCELHARVALATDLQGMAPEALRLSDPVRLAEAYGLRREVADHLLAHEIQWRAR